MKTVSLETARLLKEAGFRKECHFGYCDGELECNPSPTEWPIYAPCTDELLEELPKTINVKNSNWDLHILCNKDSFGVSYQTIISKEYSHFLQGKKFEYFWDYLYATCQKELCEALAQMYLWLHKQGLLQTK